jgi:hypothetical protein
VAPILTRISGRRSIERVREARLRAMICSAQASLMLADEGDRRRLDRRSGAVRPASVSSTVWERGK